MRNGFIFNHNKCVGCNACSAACILENRWTVHPRNIFSYNSDAEISLPIINLSLACNHCESAICMKGCPASAYSREPITGAILIDDIKCIGCRYCQWNCPYDAPKFDSENKTIAKCNLCYSGLIEGRQPACSSACPTGALSFGQLNESDSGNGYSWFPDKKLNPAIEFTAKQNNTSLKIVPKNIYGQKESKENKEEKNISDELSLIIFSFLATLSVSTMISSFVEGVFPQKMIFIPVLFLTGVVSFFHLGRKLRSWRSVMNLRNSPLSREIAAFIVYIVISFVTVFSHVPGLLIASSITGLVFLMLIDSVYIYADRSKSVFLHSGQTFISALIIVSFVSGVVVPFVFIALIKLISSFHGLYIKKANNNNFGIRILRIAFLIVPGINIILHISHTDLIIVSIFLIGELLDRILFYIDFNPLNINTLIEEQLNIERDEKKRG
jgi:Fe-S-cluster-containing dehydrogenase component/DMSO reductase anchor subunit